MQAGIEHNLIERAHFYGRRITSGALEAGDGYDCLNPTMVIFFTSETYFTTLLKQGFGAARVAPTSHVSV